MVVRDLLEKMDDSESIEIIAYDETGDYTFVFVGRKYSVPKGILEREATSIGAAVSEWIPSPYYDADKSVVVITINADTVDDDEEETVTKGEGSC